VSPLAQTVVEAAQRLGRGLRSLQLRDLISVYAAALSTWVWWRGGRSVIRVRLDVREMLDPYSGASAAKVFLVSIVNRSGHAVSMTALESITQRSGRTWIVPNRTTWQLPVEIAPRTEKNLPLPFDGLAEQGLRRVVVHLATGERARSNRVR
jgi:hypothetical protein